MKDATVIRALTRFLNECPGGDLPPGLHPVTLVWRRLEISPQSAVLAESWPEEPAGALSAIAGKLELAASLPGTAPAGFAGMAFRFEGWMVPQPQDEAGAVLLRVMAAAGELHRYPGRIDARLAWAAMRDGSFFHAWRLHSGGRVSASRDDDAAGLVPDSLRRVVRALTAGGG